MTRLAEGRGVVTGGLPVIVVRVLEVAIVYPLDSALLELVRSKSSRFPDFLKTSKGRRETIWILTKHWIGFKNGIIARKCQSTLTVAVSECSKLSC